MGNYKLIALDMDGTLLTDDKLVSAENRAAIKAANAAGVTVMIATGRGIQNVVAYVDDLQLAAPIVTVNGSEVWAAPGVLHNRTLLDLGLLKQMHAIALEYDTWYWAYAVDQIFNKEKWTDQVDAKQWLKFGYYYEDAEMMKEIRTKLEALGALEITNSHPLNIELNPKGINKASGIRQVCTLLGIEMSQVIAMGDSLNDESMIREAGLGVAMGNAQDEIKQLADVITATNEEHGVARIIEQYVLS
ncbi:Cof-type HAD-IIB family hydrolase [Paenibacillus radicis (ex Xue et al. 2023)]|uniref:Cof-type HAD-IIB family hydrolase n=1 Tax=Paenibacillus radicis (ex Xue et al. 2023) TaxID=2972489 RepID=A0ABT1Y9Q0_9BACL|nr:Cof-type HAD-IIB family hydrolase [Paenibacillus radicis (ex Xue et al. 2023)]MCR8629911.1 Cof-type HAD-IIB family hydrolase [Paenibacillus radicis (ex Xue et al. 2023)]